MTPSRLGASLTCAIATPGKPNSHARTPHSIHIRNLIVRSLYCSTRWAAVQYSPPARHCCDKRIGPLSIRYTAPLEEQIIVELLRAPHNTRHTCFSSQNPFE